MARHRERVLHDRRVVVAAPVEEAPRALDLLDRLALGEELADDVAREELAHAALDHLDAPEDRLAAVDRVDAQHRAQQLGRCRERVRMPLTLNQIVEQEREIFKAKFSNKSKNDEIKDYENLRDETLMDWLEETFGEKYVTTYDFTYDMIDHYKIKGVWYFDKRIAELKYRPLAIAPVARQVINKKDDASACPGGLSDPVDMFWIYYPDARDVLKDSYVFSDSNSVIRKSFDELINARRFHTMIFLEENMYEDREVGDYITDNAFMRLLESERIKEKIRNFEHDMWSW